MQAHRQNQLACNNSSDHGLFYDLFPLYMAVIIAFKKPSEMTNDIMGALSFPSSWSFDNFAEAMRVTDFWNSLGNSLLITALTVIIAILVHSLAGYAIGRNMGNSKFYKFAYLYIVSGMFVPFAILMMPLVKQTSQMGIGNRAGVIILYVVFYMPMNLLLYSGYLKIFLLHWKRLQEWTEREPGKLTGVLFSGDEAHACNGCRTDCPGNLE